MSGKPLEVLVNKTFKMHLKRSDISTDIAELERYVSAHEQFDSYKERKNAWKERRNGIKKFWGDIIDSLKKYLDTKGALTKPELIKTVTSLYDQEDLTTKMTLNYVVESLIKPGIKVDDTGSSFNSTMENRKITDGNLNDFKDESTKLKDGLHYNLPVYYKDFGRAKRDLMKRNYLEQRPVKDNKKNGTDDQLKYVSGYFKKVIDIFPHRKLSRTYLKFEEDNRKDEVSDDEVFELMRKYRIGKADAYRLSESRRVKTVLRLGTDTIYAIAVEEFSKLYLAKVDFRRKVDTWLIIGASADRSSKPL